MKKLLTLLFTFAVAFALAMPVFAQETTGQAPAPKAEKKVKKQKKVKKEKKEQKEEKKGEGTPKA
jgi:ribosomal protein L12E/L44/L45/RPP1/RPP2